MRKSHLYALDKLEIIRQYCAAFGKACYKKSPTFNFVDGFSGPGVNRVDETKELVDGSPLIALKSEPPFATCLLMDLGRSSIEALIERTKPFGARAVVRRGDCNKDLLPAMHECLNSLSPTLCLLDPEGTELEWPTIEGVSNFREGPRKVEQLILFPTNIGWIRMLTRDGLLPEHARTKISTMYGTDEWLKIYGRRQRGVISTETATTDYVTLYCDQLRSLGYRVLDREIRTRGHEGGLKYFLVFATTHEAGISIMNHIFDHVSRTRMEQPQLFTPERRKRGE